MRGIDTNVLVRFLTRDDAVQAEKARTLLATCTPDAPAFVTTVVLVEVFWTLRRGYNYDRPAICQALGPLLQVEELVFEQAPAVAYAFRTYQSGKGDFADALLGRTARQNGCLTTFTFDRKAAQLPDFTFLA